MANIIELIDSFLPQDIVPIYYLSLPQNTTGMLIEETGIVGEIHSFKGYDGVISSIIQFYSVIDPKDKKYTEMTAILRGFYKKVQEKVGAKKENINYNEAEEIPITSMINPTWKNISDETDIQYEGCMSVPSIRGKVKRYKKIELTYYDEKGDKIIKQLSGFFARLIQHECDHLDGINFIEKVINDNGFATKENIEKYKLREQEYIENKYKIITLCGSIKFKNEFMKVQEKFILEGNIVFTPNFFNNIKKEEIDNETKKMLDEMHKQKIDMSDEIYVINFEGYIGESTKNEIEYAKKQGKIIKYLENI